ncbi:MAG: PAS domain-containing protein [Bacteroides sp.]
MIDLCTIFEEFSVAITITDLDGTIIYMNEQSAQVNAKGGGKALVGKQVRDCHTERSKNIIEQLFQGATNAYTIEKKGVKKLIYQAPWKENGQIKGLVEFSIILPEGEMPHYIRS